MSDYKDFEKQFEAIVKGETPPPNMQPLEHKDAVNRVAAYHYKTTKGSARIGQYKKWAVYFTGTTQGGQFDGEGIVFWYEPDGGKAATFAICKHEPQELPGANHMRGWHPSKCSVCGLDMSVDSGD